jgi:L-ascorbate metabolism protein UlaG (beta-lactamase superfamily)
MRVRRLGWAGIEIEAQGVTAVVDLLEDVGPLERFIGPPQAPLLAPAAQGSVTLALVTHLHSDHTDPAAVARALAPDGLLLRPEAAAGEGLETAALAVAEHQLAKMEIPSRTVAPWQTIEAGPFRATALPAVDGFGDPQVSWLVEADGRRILHAGDTLFHGSWWLVTMRLGVADVAFLPVNGALVDLPHRQPPSSLPAAMDPVQAATAASLLEAHLFVPIHYDTLHQAPLYVQVDGAADAAVRAAAERGVEARTLVEGEWLDLGVAAGTAAAAQRTATAGESTGSGSVASPNDGISSVAGSNR